jgi:hypothetical protein
MAIDLGQLAPLIYDPARIQQLILSNTGNHSVKDPTNPFVMLLEASSAIASAAAVEGKATIKNMYPSLATKSEDVLHHISDKELINLFSHPAETSMVLYINVRDLKSNGIRPYVGKAPNAKKANYVETIIPKDSEIVVTGIPFTLLNDIRIRLYDSGVVFAEQINSTETLASNSIGILSAGIVSFQDTEPWIAAETLLLQVKKNVIHKPVTVSEGFKVSIKHSDKYYYSEVFFRTGDNKTPWVLMVNTHSDGYINPAIPTAFITVIDNMVTYEIPDVYLISGQISGEVKIVMYETQGGIDVPIYKYQMADYAVNLNTATTDTTRASIANITVYANSRDIISGGVTGYSFTELKDGIINNTLGHAVLPVTEKQLVRTGKVAGFDVYKAVDLVTERTYIAARNMTKDPSDLVYCKPDVFFNTVSVDISTLPVGSFIQTPTSIIIPSHTVFKETNGVVSIADSSVTAMLTGNTALSGDALAAYVNNNKLFFSLYHYILDTTTTAVADASVFDLDSPKLSNIRILSMNNDILERANVGKYGLKKISTGYRLSITLMTNKEFDTTAAGKVFGQLSMPLFGGSELIHFKGVYEPATKLMNFDINTDYSITSDDLLVITNGIAGVTNKTLSLSTVSDIYIYTEGANIVGGTKHLANTIVIPATETIVVLDKESLTVEIGKRINTIWDKVFTSYTDRKYITYATDEPMVYKNDIYQTDSVTGSTITIVTDVNGVKTATKTILHHRGDPILDSITGAATYAHKKGDTKLDSNGLPLINTVSGVIRYTDMLMLEYSFKAADTTVAVNYLTSIKDTIDSWLFNSMVGVNGKVIENTRVLYRSYKSAGPIELNVNSIKTMSAYQVTPVVTIYSSRNKYNYSELDNLKTGIGYIIHGYLDTPAISIADMKNDILAIMDSSVVAIKVENIETSANSEMFSTTNPTTRLSLNKTLTTNDNSELVVMYDVIVKIHKV